jgi:Arc/MetJ-type ribon-helix-helix transcriptional regulator
MHIDIAPEIEHLVREEISSGHFRSVDELIKAGVEALREKNAPKSLVQFFRESPLVGLELEFERDQDTARDIAL